MVLGLGSSKQKKDEVQKAEALRKDITTAQSELDRQRDLLSKTEREAEDSEKDVARLQHDIDSKKREHREAGERNQMLQTKLSAQHAENQRLQESLEAVRAVALETRAVRAELLAEVARQEALIREEHKALAAASIAAHSAGAQLSQEQEAERRRWQGVRTSLEDLQAQVDAKQQALDEALMARFRAKTACSAVSDELRRAQQAHQTQLDRHQAMQQQLAQQQELRQQLAEEVAGLAATLEKKERQHFFADEDRKHRQNVLSAVSESLTGTRGHLQGELGHFREQTQRARVQNPVVLQHARTPR